MMNKFDLKFLKENDESDWVDLIDKRLRDTPPSEFNIEEEKFFSIMFWHSCMCCGFIEYYQICEDSESMMKKIEESLQTIKADEYLKVIQQANLINRKIQDIYKKEYNDDDIVEDLDPYYDKLGNLDNKFYDLQEEIPLKDILLEYVKKNIDKFVEK